MRSLVETLCSPACAGRAPGTPEGRTARAAVVTALRGAGLDPYEQPVPGCNGANVLASLPGDVDRWVIVGAHFDHLGNQGGAVFWGADDNAAAVAILVEVARDLGERRPKGRGVLFASFDGEEPPYFLSNAMGSQYFVRHSPVPLDRIDMMICMDLVGHSFGSPELPSGVCQSLFALGAERSEGTPDQIDRLAQAAEGVVIRRMDAEIIPPLSDYEPFWRSEVPFLFLSCGRSRYYHTPLDTPDRLDYPKMKATATWLAAMVRDTCARPEERVRFVRGARDDAATLRSLSAITGELTGLSREAAIAKTRAEALLAACDRDGRLPARHRGEAQMLVGVLENGLA